MIRSENELKKIFYDLRAELEKKRFHILEIKVTSCAELAAFEARNPRYTHIVERIRVSLAEEGIYLRITEVGKFGLGEVSQGVVLSKFPEYFKKSQATGCPEIFISREIQVQQPDLAMYANILTRAYDCTI